MTKPPTIIKHLPANPPQPYGNFKRKANGKHKNLLLRLDLLANSL